MQLQPRLVKASETQTARPPQVRFTNWGQQFRLEAAEFQAAQATRNPRREFEQLFKPGVQ